MSRSRSRRRFLALLALGTASGCVGDTEKNAGADTRAPASADRARTQTRTRTDAPARTASREYERTTVTAYDANGTRLATVEVRVADTDRKRYVGLGETASLPPDEGMLFVHEQEDRQSYVMRGMSFPLDIVFVDANGTVTAIYHADVAGTEAPYQAEAKYVLEVNRGWANRTGLDVGDRVVPDL